MECYQPGFSDNRGLRCRYYALEPDGCVERMKGPVWCLEPLLRSH